MVSLVRHWLARRADRKAERLAHDDLDYECRYWWGDRAGSLAARCGVCNP